LAAVVAQDIGRTGAKMMDCRLLFVAGGWVIVGIVLLHLIIQASLFLIQTLESQPKVKVKKRKPTQGGISGVLPALNQSPQTEAPAADPPEEKELLNTNPEPTVEAEPAPIPEPLPSEPELKLESVEAPEINVMDFAEPVDSNTPPPASKPAQPAVDIDEDDDIWA
ncbi:MAG: hypothetical protein AAF226_11045, partial [Verrucomicrobiota bacterium]